MSRLLAAAVLVAFVPAVGAADDPKAIVAKAIKAHGGEEFLTKHKAVQSTDKGKIVVPGVGEADFMQESAYMLPDKFKHAIAIEAMNVKFRLVGLSVGDKVSVEATVNGKVEEFENLATAYKDIPPVLRVAHLTPLVTDKGYELSLIGEDKVEDKKVIGIRVTKKGEKDISVFFDAETGLLAKMEYRTVEPGNGKEVTEERIIKEYAKNGDGIPIPKKTLLKQDGKKLAEYETVELKYLEKLDDGEFKK